MVLLFKMHILYLQVKGSAPTNVQVNKEREGFFSSIDWKDGLFLSFFIEERVFG